MDNYLQKRIQELQGDREQRIYTRLVQLCYDPTSQEQMSRISLTEDDKWETMEIDGKVILRWSKEPQLVNGEIEYIYD